MLNPLNRPTQQSHIGIGTQEDNATLSQVQYQALRRVVGLRFNISKIGDEYAVLARSVGKTEHQVILADWQCLGNMFAQDLTTVG